jgi:hypothetical protein
MNVRHFVLPIAFAALSGCGVETVGAAATGAAARKQEVGQAPKALEQSRQKIEQVQEAQRQRVHAAE